MIFIKTNLVSSKIFPRIFLICAILIWWIKVYTANQFLLFSFQIIFLIRIIPPSRNFAFICRNSIYLIFYFCLFFIFFSFFKNLFCIDKIFFLIVINIVIPQELACSESYLSLRPSIQIFTFDFFLLTDSKIYDSFNQ